MKLNGKLDAQLHVVLTWILYTDERLTSGRGVKLPSSNCSGGCVDVVKKNASLRNRILQYFLIFQRYKYLTFRLHNILLLLRQ
jgi:hypothetical protein